MPRWKLSLAKSRLPGALEILRSEAYLAVRGNEPTPCLTPGRLRETPQMGLFQQPAKEEAATSLKAIIFRGKSIIQSKGGIIMEKNLLKKCLRVGGVMVVIGFMAQIGFPSGVCAKEPFKIGAIFSFTGAAAIHSIQVKETLDWMVPQINAKGGILGRKVEVLYEDEKMDPATALRKARKLVEEDKINILLGTMISPSALAISAMLPQWKTVMIAPVNGAAELTGSKYCKYFFRVSYGVPMETRAMALFLKDNPQYKTFYGMGIDSVWGRGMADAFQKGIEKLGRKWVGSVFVPYNTTEFSSYIAKIRLDKPDIVFTTIVAGEAVAFNTQSNKFGLTKESQFFLAQLPLTELEATGDVMENFIGFSRYAFTIDNPVNKAFVERFHKDTGKFPDFYHGTTYDSMSLLIKAAAKAGSDDPDAIVKAMEGMEVDGLHGKFAMRACDHQAVMDGFIAKAVKAKGYPHLIPQILKTYPGEDLVAQCRKDTHD
jgi:branched-chain amino acid transport system substrate-binding protein